MITVDMETMNLLAEDHINHIQSKETIMTTANKRDFASIDVLREETYKRYKTGEITLEEARAIELYLNKREYRANYNKRPEVQQKRKAYMRARNEKVKMGAELLKGFRRD